MKINANQPKSLKLYEIAWKSMKMNEINKNQLFCRMGGENGEPLSWSAPSYFDLMVPGGGAEFSKVELCFVVPDDTTLNLFTKGSIGMELPKSRGEETATAR